MCSELYFHSLLFPLHWGITVQFEWFICFGIVCSGLSGWSVEYAVCLVCSACALWSSFGIQVDAWRLKFRTVTICSLFLLTFPIVELCAYRVMEDWNSGQWQEQDASFASSFCLSVWIFPTSYSIFIFILIFVSIKFKHQARSVSLDIPIFIFLIFILLIFVSIKVQRTLWPMNRKGVAFLGL